jgi:DnaK suppressor protein
MTPEELDQFRRLLSSLRAETLESCQSLLSDALREEEGEIPGNGDPLDEMGRFFDGDRAISGGGYLGQAQTQLQEITRALEEMDRSTFGYCGECGQAIPKSRLIALPTAAACFSCQSGKESS